MPLRVCVGLAVEQARYQGGWQRGSILAALSRFVSQADLGLVIFMPFVIHIYRYNPQPGQSWHLVVMALMLNLHRKCSFMMVADLSRDSCIQRYDHVDFLNLGHNHETGTRMMHGMRYGLGFYAVSLLLSLTPALGYARHKPLPAACTTHCKVVFGKVLGVGAGNVPAYSNCNANCVDRAPDIKNGTYTGIKWQCVEYARRWLLQNKGVVYGDVNVAADIWGLKFVTRVRDKTRLKMINYPNGSRTRPVAGDLLVYARAYLKTGHVAVISKVNTKQHRIEVLEQNYRNTKWPGDYARSIPYIKRHHHYWLLDAFLLGWKHITKQHFITAAK